MTTQRVDRRGSLATQVLERAWRRLRKAIPRLPPAVMLPLDVAGRRRKRGHFAPSAWRVRGPRHAHEVAISPSLFGSAEELLGTLVHEAAHALLFATASSPKHIAGVSVRDPYYHRREFRDQCQRLGLECAYLNGRYGWTLTQWPASGVPAQYLPVLKIVATLPLGSDGVLGRRVEGRQTPAFGLLRLRCACEPKRTIHVARGQRDRGAIVCMACGGHFREQTELGGS